MPALPAQPGDEASQRSGCCFCAASSVWVTSPIAPWPPQFISSLRLRKPLLIEGHAGLGKTEVAKVLAAMLGTQLIRLQCYEGLDVSSAVYEWNYQKQLLAIKIQEGTRTNG